MGYTTYFNGSFEITPPLSPEHRAYLTQFAKVRHMRRNAEITKTLPDPLREAVGLPVGFEGAYYVGDTESGFLTMRKPDEDGKTGLERPNDVVDYNQPPGQPSMDDVPADKVMDNLGNRIWDHMRAEREAIEGGAVPGLWCQWIPNEDGTDIVWDEGEKFYEYVPWIRYLITNFLKPWGYSVTGSVWWEGEEADDRGLIRITDNEVNVGHGQIDYRFQNKRALPLETDEFGQADYVLPDQAEDAWIRVGNIAVLLRRTGDGVAADLYPADADVNAPLATAVALFADADKVQRGAVPTADSVLGILKP